MILHIKIKHIVNFYMSFTRQNPNRIHRVIVDEHLRVNEISLTKEDLALTLDRVNMWIGNCDQKASFILAIIGVGLTIICSGDSMKYVWINFVEPVKLMFANNIPVRYMTIVMAFLLLLIALSIILSILQMIYSLRAKTDLVKFSQDRMQTDSMFHYQSIAKRTYKEFCENEVQVLNDLRTQVYVNSVICTSKFSHYKKGVRFFEISIYLLLIFIVFILITK